MTTKSFIYLFVVASMLSSCLSSKNVNMRTMRPADISLPSEVKNILLLDRTKYNRSSVDIIEGVLTGELPGNDKAAVQQALNSLRTEIQISPKFDAIVARERLEGNSLTNAFPTPISTYTISNLASKYDCQAIVAIEIFDTDLIITDGMRKKKKVVGQGAEKKEIEVEEFYAEGVGSLKMGIRLYDAYTGNVIDEQLVNNGGKWSSAANSKLEALTQLISRSQASIEMSKTIGTDYVYKIAPSPITITRAFYRKHKKAPKIEIGSRLADVNKWEDAIDAWKMGIGQSHKSKYDGYLAHNIAVGYEVLGNYNQAIQWAQDAYANYGNDKSKSYVSALNQRKRASERLRQQINQ